MAWDEEQKKDIEKWQGETNKLSETLSTLTARLDSLPKTPDNSADLAAIKAEMKETKEALATAQQELKEAISELASLKKTPGSQEPKDEADPKAVKTSPRKRQAAERWV